MPKIFVFLIGLALGGILMFSAMTFHLLRGRDGFHVTAKIPARLGETYVDIRSFNMTDWTQRPQLAASLVHANKKHLMSDSVAGNIQDGLDQMVPQWPNQ